MKNVVIATSTVTAVEPDTYSEDQRPCIVAKKACGCYCGAGGLDDEEIQELIEWDVERDIDRPALIEFLKDLKGCTFEIRPVSFVRNGGLTFGCDHELKAEGGE